MSKKWNSLSSVEKYSKLKGGKLACKFGKWISILSPYIIIGAVNFQDYFTEYNGVKMSMGCTLALMVGGIAIYNESKGEGKRLPNLVKWAIAFALVYLLNSILNDLLLIVGCGLIGQLVGAGFEMGEDSLNEKAMIYREANIQAQAQAEALKNNNNS